MKRLDFSQVKKPEMLSPTHKTGHKRPFFKLPDAKILLGVGLAFGLSGPMVFPKLVRAQDTSTQAITTDKKQLPPELANLPKVTLDEMKKLDKATKSDINPQFVIGNTDTTTQHVWRTPHLAWEISTEVAYPDGSGVMSVHAIIDTTNYKQGTFDKNGDEFIQSTGKRVVIIINGKPNNFIDLASLDALYRKATGNELKFVKLVAFSGKDSDLGAYAAVHVIPVDKQDGDIVAGVPILTVAVQATTKEAYTGENLISMR